MGEARDGGKETAYILHHAHKHLHRLCVLRDSGSNKRLGVLDLRERLEDLELVETRVFLEIFLPAMDAHMGRPLRNSV